jgi:hypothetical protein
MCLYTIHYIPEALHCPLLIHYILYTTYYILYTKYYILYPIPEALHCPLEHPAVEGQQQHLQQGPGQQQAPETV